MLAFPMTARKCEKTELKTKVDHESYRARGAPAKTRYSGHLYSPPNPKVAQKRPPVRFSYYMKEHGKVAICGKWKREWADGESQMINSLGQFRGDCNWVCLYFINVCTLERQRIYWMHLVVLVHERWYLYIWSWVRASFAGIWKLNAKCLVGFQCGMAEISHTDPSMGLFWIRMYWIGKEF